MVSDNPSTYIPWYRYVRGADRGYSSCGLSLTAMPPTADCSFRLLLLPSGLMVPCPTWHVHACSTSAPQHLKGQCTYSTNTTCSTASIISPWETPPVLLACLHPSASKSHQPTNPCFRSTCSAPRQNHAPFLSQHRHGCGGRCGRPSRHRALREPDAVVAQGVRVCGRGELLRRSFFFSTVNTNG